MFKAEITIPEPVAGKDYTLQLIKLGTEKHERYSWTEMCIRDSSSST